MATETTFLDINKTIEAVMLNYNVRIKAARADNSEEGVALLRNFRRCY